MQTNSSVQAWTDLNQSNQFDSNLIHLMSSYSDARKNLQTPKAGCVLLRRSRRSRILLNRAIKASPKVTYDKKTLGHYLPA